MSTMNVLSITLVVLIIGSVAALFFGMRAASEASISVPIHTPTAVAQTIAAL